MIGYLTRNHPLIQAFAAAPAPRTRRETRGASRVFRAAPRLAELLAGSEAGVVKGELGRPISGLASEVERVTPGAVYFAVAKPGAEGRLGIDEALRRGAVAIIAPRLPSLRAARATWVEVPDVAAALAKAAQRFYGFPDRDLTVVGVTGHGGRTTVAHLIKHLMEGDRRVGLIGAVHYDLGARTVPAYRALPGSLDLFGLMAQMREAGCRQAVLEMKTAVEQRLDDLRLGAVVVTGGSEGEGGRLRHPVHGGATHPPPVLVAKLGSAEGRAFAGRVAAGEAGTRVVTYGESGAAQVRAEQVRLRSDGAQLQVVWPEGRLEVQSPLLGAANVDNLLAAVATAWGLGRDPRVVLARLRSFAGVPGILQRVTGGEGLAAIVDRACTSSALRQTLEQLRPITPGRLLLVFGCGADHDPAERAEMTRTAQTLADFAVATADNPRAEPMARVFAQMAAGVSAPDRIAWMPDRRRAIALAVGLARWGDCVLVAGKGHDTWQQLGDTVFPFDDRLVLREAIAAGRGRGEG